MRVMRALDIRHITVRKGALDLEVAAALGTLYVSASVAQRILQQLPNLAKHVCVNGRGETFGDELVGTELPHLLEHVIIELQGQANPEHGSTFTGHTSWLEELERTRAEGIALMRVTVTFIDDLEALRACEQARAIIEHAVAAE